MKEFMKTCAVIALIIFLMGSALVTFAALQGNVSDIVKTVDSVSNGKIKLHMNSWYDWGFTVKDKDGHIGIGNSGEVNGYVIGENADHLVITVDSCELNIKESDDEFFYADAENAENFEAYMEGDTIYVMSDFGNMIHTKSPRVTLYVPVGRKLDSCEIELGAGKIDCGNLRADLAAIDVGAGELIVKEMTAKEIHVDVDMGHVEVRKMSTDTFDVSVNLGSLELAGDCRKAGSASCDMGSITLDLEGSREDYMIDAECSMGTLTVDGKKYSGNASIQHDSGHHNSGHHNGEHDEYEEYNASKGLDVSCNMGNLKISFK